MSWVEWVGAWALALGFTAVVVALAFWLGLWALPLVFGTAIIGGGLVVCRAPEPRSGEERIR